MDWTALGSIATVIGLLIVAFQIRQDAARKHAEDRRICRQATLEYARETIDLRFRNWKDLPDDFDRQDVERTVEKMTIESDDNMQALVQEYLGVVETFCLGISMGIYDQDAAFELYGQRIIAVSDHYHGFIQARRAHTRNQAMYIGIEEMGATLRQYEKSRLKRGLPVR